jgi:HD-like signal output (HDOD) protein
MTRRVLFVDDEPNILSGMRRLLHPFREEITPAFASSGAEALGILDKESFEVVVSDMRMPGMDGASLLTEVMKRWPNTVRIVLSGQSDKETILRSIGPTHQFLSKPCDSQTLLDTIRRSCALRDLLADARLQELVGRMTTLPTLPSVYAEIAAELQAGNASVAHIAGLVTQDLGMTAKVLQLVNSSYFGLPQRISEPRQAVSLLGLDALKALFLSTQVFTQFEGRDLGGFTLEESGNHAAQVGALARSIAMAENASSAMADDSLMAGLMHDVGKLVLAVNLPDQYAMIMRTASQEQVDVWEMEIEMLGLDHADVGVFLLGLWGLPDTVLEAIAFHHRPNSCLSQGFTATSAVHAADSLVRGRQPDPGLMAVLGLADRVEAWKELMKSKENGGGHA